MKVWITRDKKSGEEPELLMLHTSEPILYHGSWISEACCYWSPLISHGERSRIDLLPNTPRRRGHE